MFYKGNKYAHPARTQIHPQGFSENGFRESRDTRCMLGKPSRTAC